MNKRQANTILRACKKHSISLTMCKEGSVYKVTFIKRIEVKSFEGAKLITNGLVLETRENNKIKEHIENIQSHPKLNFSNHPKKKLRPDSGVTFAERRGNIED